MPVPLTLVSDYERAGKDRRSLARQAERGLLVRVRSGVYVPAETWNGLKWWDQYRLHIEAVAQTASSPHTFSRQSAAALWGIPFFGMRNDVHIVTATNTQGRRSAGVRSHRDRHLDAPVLHQGHWVTSRAATVVELSLAVPFGQAVAAVDHVLKRDQQRSLAPLDKDIIMAVAERLRTQTKIDRVAKVVQFADARSGSPGESLSRAIMFLQGFPQPELQYPVRAEDGSLLGVSDFYWSERRLLGEYDGQVKYSRNEYLRGVLPSDVLAAEKAREDAMRETGRSMVRWLWADIWGVAPGSAASLGSKLCRAGLVPDRRKHLWLPGPASRKGE